MKLRATTIATIERLKYQKPKAPEIRTNPFTLVSCTLEPDAIQLYDFITTSHYTCGQDYTRQSWDNARYHFLSRWPDEYYKLLD